MFLGLLDPDPGPLVRGMDPNPDLLDPDPDQHQNVMDPQHMAETASYY